MTIKDILIEWLKSHGYDGLCNPDISCGCGIRSEQDDFMPCGGDYGVSSCEPAMMKIATEDDIDDESEFDIGDEIFIPIKEKP